MVERAVTSPIKSPIGITDSCWYRRKTVKLLVGCVLHAMLCVPSLLIFDQLRFLCNQQWKHILSFVMQVKFIMVCKIWSLFYRLSKPQVKMSCTIKSPTRASRTKRVMSHNLWGEFILIIKLQTLPNRNPSFHLKKKKKTNVWGKPSKKKYTGLFGNCSQTSDPPPFGNPSFKMKFFGWFCEQFSLFFGWF